MRNVFLHSYIWLLSNVEIIEAVDGNFRAYIQDKHEGRRHHSVMVKQ